LDVLLDLTPLDTVSRYQGIGHYAASLGQALAALTPAERRGLEIAALTGLQGPGLVGPLGWRGSERPPYAADRFDMRYVWDRRSRLALSLHSVRPRPRLLHVTQGLGTPRGSFVPRVITCHDMIRLALHRQYLGPSRAYRLAYRLCEAARHASARRVIAVSRFTADDLMRHLRIPASRIDVVHHGVDAARFCPPSTPAQEAAQRAQRSELGIGQKPYFLCVGSTDPRKRAGLLLSAFCRARLADVELIFAGLLTPAQRAELDQVWRAEGSPPGVRFVGFVPDARMNAVMHGALALVFPSIYEGFGMPVLEAMAAGCPVVTTASTCLGEVAGDAALLVPPDDLDALTSALRRAAADGGLRSQLRAAGLARAAEFSWKKTALGTVDAYLKALR